MIKRAKQQRGNLVLAMETICRHINDEDIFDKWLMCGVGDGDITSETTWDDENLEFYYENNDIFAELMDCFLRCMKEAYKSGGLYCDKVVSNVG